MTITSDTTRPREVSPPDQGTDTRHIPEAEQARLRAELGGLLWTERAARGWSQRQLAESAGLSARTVTRLEGGQQHVTPRTLGKLAAALRPGCDEVTVTELALMLERAAGPSLRRQRRKPLRKRTERVRAEAAARLDGPKPAKTGDLALACALAALEPEPELWPGRRPSAGGTR